MVVLVYLVLSFGFCFPEAVTSVPRDVMSLLSFKSSISSDPSNVLSDWNPAENHCHWYGVTCDRLTGAVIALNITGTVSSRSPLLSFDSTSKEPLPFLSGTLPASLGNLTELRVLSLPYNGFYGAIPAEFGALRSLQILKLQGNNFSGWIPDQMRYLSSLRILNLSFNSFSGPIPEKLIGSSGLRAIDLSYNQLSGAIKIDPSSGCESLRHLKLSGNLLVDKIPPEIGNCSNLRTLLLDGNILEGRIPAEIGNILELRTLDVSRNSLSDSIPKELAKCRKLSVIVLTNLVDPITFDDSSIETSEVEFNAFVGGIPSEIFLLPNLEILWAPRANLGGRLPTSWNDSCQLRVVNLAQNYIAGPLPGAMGLCKCLSFLDLSSNVLQGFLPPQMPVQCMFYFNISRNALSGSLAVFPNSSCLSSLNSESQDNNVLNFPMHKLFGSMFREDSVVFHDFSWNGFSGLLPVFSLGNELLPAGHRTSYWLLLNNNQFNGSLPDRLFSDCEKLHTFTVNLSVNHLSGGISQGLLLSCVQLMGFDAAHNQIGGSIPSGISNSQFLQRLDLRGNRFSGSVPIQLGKLKDLKWVLLGGNLLTGEIPAQLGQLASLMVLDLSSNALTGSIPASLADASNLEVLLLDHNKLSGEIPTSLSNLISLSQMNVSFNNLSGSIHYLRHFSDCDCFRGNPFLQPCLDPQSAPPAELPFPVEVQEWRKSQSKSSIIAMAASASVIFLILLAIVLLLTFGRRQFSRLPSPRSKEVVTFTDAPSELNYENVVRATGNFSIRNLIGMGGFGATYKAELFSGFLVAVKKLYLGRFQGIQQFDAEIRTLGRIRHKNLVTLIGYYMGETEMFLIYNYLSGGNLETFIHDKLAKNAQWHIICKIALHIAQALAYLHYSCVPRVIHRDIKPSNILLDEEHNAYLSDFGLARLLEVFETHATTDVAGTFGYVAPEYATTCRVSEKADVYSYGVVLLELMSGKRTLDPSFSEYGDGFNIVAWSKLLIMEGRASELFFPELWDAGPRENLLRLLRLASTCTMESLSVRPSMKHVVEKLKQLATM
ncbi:LRR receptor-like serine/threonine-protein kinase RPK2 [Macadamia integrifolia]|uniref:LRR receptor-like serine/threonine-protein kinase RPK2 n=1 Tax=Macadamia integrifolia TaxID=60698 RepID=UPI001C4F6D1C|nr:LRR receptor-like serine/threonine-protein kinase RPK2 [Macadamia integrifolia]